MRKAGNNEVRVFFMPPKRVAVHGARQEDMFSRMNRTMTDRPTDLWLPLFCRALLVLAFLIPWVVCLCECVFGPALCDSTVFRYMGWRYATGTGGYAHAWDCKGPVLVLLNALGYWLGIPPIVVFAGLWSGIVILFNRFLKRLTVRMSEGWTLLLVLAFLSSECVPFLNSTETVAIFFSLLSVACVWGKRAAFRWLVVGGAAAAVFFTKPNLISFAAALGLSCVVESVRKHELWRMARCMACSFAGAALVFGFISLAFWNCGYREMWDATLGYNLLERCVGIKLSWGVWWWHRLFRQGWSSWFPAVQFWTWLTTGGILIGLGGLRLWRSKMDLMAYLPLTAWLFLEMAMVFASKGYYPHYMMVSFVPLLALLALCLSDAKTPKGNRRLPVVLAFLIVGCMPFAVLGIWHVIRGAQLAQPGFKEIEKVVPSGSQVSVCGSLVLPEVLTRLKLTTDQKYFSWLFYAKNCSDERRLENERGFRRSLETCEWLLSETDQAALASSMGFECVLETERPHVFVYRKR